MPLIVVECFPEDSPNQMREQDKVTMNEPLLGIQREKSSERQGDMVERELEMNRLE